MFEGLFGDWQEIAKQVPFYFNKQTLGLSDKVWAVSVGANCFWPAILL